MEVLMLGLSFSLFFSLCEHILFTIALSSLLSFCYCLTNNGSFYVIWFAMGPNLPPIPKQSLSSKANSNPVQSVCLCSRGKWPFLGPICYLPVLVIPSRLMISRILVLLFCNLTFVCQLSPSPVSRPKWGSASYWSSSLPRTCWYLRFTLSKQLIVSPNSRTSCSSVPFAGNVVQIPLQLPKPRDHLKVLLPPDPLPNDSVLPTLS
jgi:hypothetical protein